MAAIVLTIAAVLFYSCEKNNDSVIDPSYAGPTLSNSFLSKDTVFTTSSGPIINLIASVLVNTNGGGSVGTATCTVNDPDGNVAGEFNLIDNGTPPDTNSNDSRYTAAINITNIQCLLVGNYTVEFLAENETGIFSNLIISDFTVVNTANVPPQISGTNLPDSVIRPAQGSPPFNLTISINVNDPNGICDIKGSSFISIRPNGDTIKNGNVPFVFPMIGNGSGLFSFTNPVNYSADPTSYGYFKYIFTAIDNSNLLSTTVKDSIKFVMP